MCWNLGEVADIYSAWWEGDLDDDEFITSLGKRGFDAPMLGIHRYVDWAASQPDIKVIITTR